jgi:hypothetical protein
MAAIGNYCFWLVNFLKSSSLKLLSQMNRNFVGNIYGRFSIKFANFVPIRLNKHGCHGRFLETDQPETRIAYGMAAMFV